MLTRLDKAPFPWFGGKSRAAERVWALLGDVSHYVEPFCGSCAVLLRRPHQPNRTYFSETVNDADGLLINAWRSIQLYPDETAGHASNPVAEADLHARHYALVKWRQDREFEHLMGDPSWCDPGMAGWWLWGVSCWIGGGWCSGSGPWRPDETGRLTKQPRGTREPGVYRKRPHITNNGDGVNAAKAREPGVNRQLPHLGDDGRGINHAGTREPGVEFHEVTMPELTRWFRWLSARLRHVRILNGDWARVLTPSATLTVDVRMGGHGKCGVFLDPPYADTANRTDELYAHDSNQIAHRVRDWAVKHGDDHRYRIVLAGYTDEHDMPDTWTCVDWFTDGFLTGGMGSQQHRERLWASPHCLDATGPLQLAVFDVPEPDSENAK